MSAQSDLDVKIALAGCDLPQWFGLACHGRAVKHETGFKTFLNTLDYSAVFLMAYQDHPPY
ncbi:hypothetical protein D3C81_427270 [compost metagenome]